MKKLLVIALLAMTIPIKANASEPILEKIRCTCYTSKPTATTYSGKPVRKGVVSGKKEWLNRTAIIYSTEYEFIEIIEFLDTGSAKGLNNGTVIDLWQPSLADCDNFTDEFGDYVYLQWVD